MINHHSFHPYHPLVSDLVSKRSFAVECKACASDIRSNGPSYGCEECEFYLHEHCARLEKEIQGLSEHDQHRILLCNRGVDQVQILKHNQWVTVERTSCGGCKRRSGGIPYRCRVCRICLCLECALENTDPSSDITFQHEGHQLVLSHHPTINNWSSCLVCNETLELPVFKCKVRDCYYRIHAHCAPLEYPKSAQNKHLHPLTFQEKFVEDDSEEYYCDACERRRHPDTPVYSCAQCYSASAPYTAHITCSLSNEDLRSLAKGYESSEKFKTLQHHQHHLNFADTSWFPEEKNCIVCKLSLQTFDYPNLYCKDCNFYLHYKCRELDTTFEHPIHSEHPLCLHVDTTDMGPFFQCNACKEMCLSFMYRCNCCNFNLCVRCIQSVQTTTVFKYREHKLFLFDLEVRGCKCDYCGGNKTSHRFICMDRGCKYTLHFHCAPFNFRESIEHRGHEHSLRKIMHSTRTEKCYICDGFPREDDFLYCCEACNAIAHPSCASLEIVSKLIEEFDNSRENQITRFNEDLKTLRLKQEELRERQKEIKKFLSSSLLL